MEEITTVEANGLLGKSYKGLVASSGGVFLYAVTHVSLEWSEEYKWMVENSNSGYIEYHDTLLEAVEDYNSVIIDL